MLRSLVLPEYVAQFASRARLAAFALVAGQLTLAPSLAAGCEIWTERGDGSVAALAPAELPEKTVGAILRCGKDARRVVIWTLGVDASAQHLGVRDAPLFRTEFTGPLRKVAEADIPGDARVSVLERANLQKTSGGGAPLPSYRRFLTFCDADQQENAPLDCSLRGARIKARSTAHDSDFDGALDIVKHEISLYLGRDRLHVVSFMEAYRPSALSGASSWIDVLNGFRALPSGS